MKTHRRLCRLGTQLIQIPVNGRVLGALKLEIML